MGLPPLRGMRWTFMGPSSKLTHCAGPFSPRRYCPCTYMVLSETESKTLGKVPFRVQPKCLSARCDKHVCLKATTSHFAKLNQCKVRDPVLYKVLLLVLLLECPRPNVGSSLTAEWYTEPRTSLQQCKPHGISKHRNTAPVSGCVCHLPAMMIT